MFETPLWTAQDFADATHVPHGTLSDFTQWYGLLRKWNARINLVAPKEADAFWRRHAYDSWQLTQHLPENWTRLVDLGSGGGFPGLAFGILAKQNAARSGPREVHLVESVGKKTSFLKTVTRELGLPVTVHTARVENLPPLKADVLTARAFAPLPRIFAYAQPHLSNSAILLLPKGESADKEIESAREGWHFDVESFKSQTDDAAAILRIKGLRPK
jgi:16S rRNA (guanine527-N7)-methyltransferase